ncbi:unnamed protein product [Schistocephalus solidus]|uniref:Uncharacterized protein n=1 Tax=Schistocephalus solidus TaxID=70667 RepID=A0A183T5U3_SCHSO|nr:unnamed protein product [Schistocephalus solidus]
MGTNQEESLDFEVNENTMTSEGSELTFRSAQGDCEDSTVDSFCASGSPGKPLPFISPLTSPISKECDKRQRDAGHQAWGDHPLPRAATDTFLSSPSTSNTILNGGRAPQPPCPASTPTASQISILSLDSETCDSLRDKTTISRVLAPVRTVSATAPCSASTESVDAFTTRTGRASSVAGLQEFEFRSYSPAHLVVDACHPASEAARGVVEGRPGGISCRSQSFFSPPGDQQSGIDVNVQVSVPANPTFLILLKNETACTSGLHVAVRLRPKIRICGFIVFASNHHLLKSPFC